jgi:hypothetical protein
MPSADSRVESCCKAFAYLVDRFGFAEPEAETIGREQYVCFHRGNSTVSIAWEAGAQPIVELFHPPANATERAVFWAERNGVARCRRIPLLRVSASFDYENPASFEGYLRAQAAELVREEREWLHAGMGPAHA